MRALPVFLTAISGLIFTSAVNSQENIKIGVVTPVTGIMAQRGAELLAGTKLAAKKINRNGGISGRPVKVIALDSECNPMRAADAARAFGERHQIAIAIEYECGNSQFGTEKILSEFGMPHLVYSTNTTDGLNYPRLQGSIAVTGMNSLTQMVEAMVSNKINVSDASVAGYAAMELAGQAVRKAGRTDYQSTVDALSRVQHTTSAGNIIFAPPLYADGGPQNTFVFDLWTKKKDCPKCPKGGACPQSLYSMIAGKKTCN